MLMTMMTVTKRESRERTVRNRESDHDEIDGARFIHPSGQLHTEKEATCYFPEEKVKSMRGAYGFDQVFDNTLIGLEMI